MTDARTADLRRRFHTLHRSGCFVSPNPWDVGSARLLAGMGFKALATTSSGYAWSTGRLDHQIIVDDALEHLFELTAAVDVPISADFEGGFAVEPADVAANVSRAVENTAVAGLSIEDSSGDASEPLFDFTLAVERIAAARQAMDREMSGAFLIARSEGFIAGRPDLDETIKRLTAFAEAGADCLFAPGIRTEEQISAIVNAVAPKPVNVLVSAPFITVERLAELGVRRVSVGGALARAAWSGFLRAAREIAEQGTFKALGEAISPADLNAMFPRHP
ncbi:MAG: isocitrate lyase/phosphoenolpyruvate mutase family protein [Vicinamibacterales bacterium]